MAASQMVEHMLTAIQPNGISGVFIFVLIVLLFILGYSRALNLLEKKNCIPGPKPSDPISGNLLDIEKTGGLTKYLIALHANYGDVAQFWLGRNPAVSTASPQSFKPQRRIFDKPGIPWIAPVFGERTIQFCNGQEGRTRRQNYDVFVNVNNVHQYFEIFKKIADNKVAELLALPPKAIININDHLFDITVKAVGLTMFGEFFQTEDNFRRFRRLYLEFWPVLEKNFTSGLPPDGTKEREHFNEVVDETHGVVRDIIEHRQKGNHSDRKLIDVILEMALDQTTIYGDILVYLVGGFHNGSSVTLDKLSEFRYLKQFINETLRLRFTAPMAVRLADDNTVIGGYKIPKDTTIVQAICAAQSSPDIWDNPERFDPSRFDPGWSKQNGSNERHPSNPYSLAFIPFGFAGKRMCPGKKFFFDEALVFLSTLLQNFTFDLSDPADVDVEITYGMVTRPANDIHLIINRRKYSQ